MGHKVHPIGFRLGFIKDWQSKWYAKKILDLKILAVNGDNEFRNPQADINLQRACDALNVDFVSIRSKKDYGHKIVKNRIKNGRSK